MTDAENICFVNIPQNTLDVENVRRSSRVKHAPAYLEVYETTLPSSIHHTHNSAHLFVNII